MTVSPPARWEGMLAYHVYPWCLPDGKRTQVPLPINIDYPQHEWP